MKKLLLAVVLLFVLVAAGVFLVNSSTLENLFPRRPEDQPKLDTPLPVVYTTVFETVSANGAVEPRETLIISGEQSGVVVRLPYDVDDVVEEGQELLQLDDRQQQAQLRQAEELLKAAQAGVDQAASGVDAAESKRVAAQKELERVREQVRKGNLTAESQTIREAQLDVAVAEKNAAQRAVAMAEAKLHAAQAQRDQAQLAVDLTHVRVPFVEHARAAGSNARLQEVGTASPTRPEGKPLRKYTIIDRKVRLNQPVDPRDSGPLFVLAADLGKMVLRARVAEGDIAKVQSGETAYFTVSAYENYFFTGKVVETRPTPTLDNNAIYFTVLLDIDEPPAGADKRLRPGMTAASLDIVSRVVPEAAGEQTWAVPDAAVNFPLDRQYWAHDVKEGPTPPDGWKWVWYKDEATNTARFTYVQVGASGKIKDPATGGLRADTYTQVLKWDPKLTPPLHPDSPEELKVITGAEPGKRRFQIPNMIKS